MTVAPASRAADAAMPAHLAGCSDALGWSAPLLRVYEQPAVAEEFTVPATPDLLAVLVLDGRFTIESRLGGRWHAAHYRPGSIGVTAPGHCDVLRWREPAAGRRSTLHVHLPAQLLAQARADLPPGSRNADLNSLDLVEPTVGAILAALHTAFRWRAEPLVAESLAHALAVRLVGSAPADPRPPCATLSPAAFGRVVDYMRAHLADPVGLDDLAREAGYSRFHFLRLFAATAGATPHRFLTEMRLERGAELLRSGRLTVAAVAVRCGYPSTARFTALFRARYGTTPGRFSRIGA